MAASQAGQDEEVEDYMSMVIEEPKRTAKESSFHRAARLKREHEARSQQKTKKELEQDEHFARENGLETHLDTSNKGYKLMAKLGYKSGATLGKTSAGRLEPVQVSMKDDRGGIGMESEKKRKMREAMEEREKVEKKARMDEVDYRDWVYRERTEKRLQAQLRAAQHVAQELDMAQEESLQNDGAKVIPWDKRTLNSINLCWRELAKDSREHEAKDRREREVRNSLAHQRHSDYDDSSEDDEHTSTRRSRLDIWETHEQDLDDEDEELDQFNELPTSERLQKVVLYLRENHLYCFWCKSKYPDTEFLGCPGLTEEAHEL